jgi:uncharacterized surface protein with fasciclin (FAS1) repeats
MESNGGKIIAIILTGAVLIGGVVWFVTNNNNNDSNSSVDTSQQTPVEQESTQATNTIVDLAVATPELSTLVSAVQAASLVETLSGDGPFTVFAPTNSAFNALPEGTLASLLLPENKQNLTDILTYHVVSGNVMSSDLSDGQVITTLNGDTLTVSIQNGVVKVGNATVTTPDVKASNGVVHVIDTVLLPQ